MKLPCTGVILAGGRNTRFSGKNKAFLCIRGKRIVDHIYAVFNDLFERTILVTNDPSPYLGMDCLIVTDIFSIRSSLTGIHTGLFYTATPYAFFSACDTPFLKKELVETLFNETDPGVDVVIPQTSAGLEPLCAIYSKRCLKPVEQQLSKKNLKIEDFFSNVRVKKISAATLADKDPDLISFFNINTPEDMIRAEAIGAENRALDT